MTNIAKWKDPPFFSSVNHLFLWTIYTMAMLVITRGYILIYISWLYSLHHFQVPKKQGRVGSMVFFNFNFLWIQIWLVVSTPSEKHEFVSWSYYYSQYMEKMEK